jgi:dihydroorotase
MDLLLKGGRVIDPSQNLDQKQDVAFKNGMVVRVSSRFGNVKAYEEVDVSGCLVLPGLIDFHTHVYWGATALSVKADPLAFRSGVTTFVDAGSAGPGNFRGLKDFIIDRSTSRILAFLHIVYPGIVTIGRERGKEFIVELTDPRLFNSLAALRAAREYPEDIVGIKVRAGVNSDGPTLDPVRTARLVAEEIEKPLMVHLGGPPPLLEMLLPLLRPGDIATHIFRPAPNAIIDSRGQLRREVKEAIDRGVIFDVAHGAGGFSFEIAEKAIKQGIKPNIISTDIHSSNIEGPVYDLPTTLNKFLALGMDLKEVIAAATINPARAIKWDDRIGHLSPGAYGDASIFKLEENEIELQDALGVKRVGQQFIKYEGMVIHGKYYPHIP